MDVIASLSAHSCTFPDELDAFRKHSLPYLGAVRTRQILTARAVDHLSINFSFTHPHV
jgi:hypothetical protein